MAMTQADINTARAATQLAKQTAYEAMYAAIVAKDKPAKQAAKDLIGDANDRDDVLNNIQAAFNALNPGP